MFAHPVPVVATPDVAAAAKERSRAATKRGAITATVADVIGVCNNINIL